MSSCLVTGGSGFLGRRVTRALAEAGHEVTVLARSPAKGYSAVLCDLGRGEVDLGELHPRHVYHLAGLAHFEPRTDRDARRFTEVNVEGTRRLLRALDRCPEPPHSVLLASTVAVYGLQEGQGLDEMQDRRAQDPYGRSKREAEDIVLAWGENQRVLTGIVRLPLVAGPAAPGNLRRMLSAIAAGRYVGVGDGTTRRSMVRLSDVAGILPRVSEVGGIYHLTDGDHPSFKALESAVAAALGRPSPPRLPLPLARAAALVGDVLERLTGRPLPFNRRVFDRMSRTLTFSDERARRELGWRPTRVLDAIPELLRGNHLETSPGGRGNVP
jgi:nucleoside-diphosphate-sugar epimerase